MKENENKIAGYCFTDAHDYKEAKREAETVEYIKANTDLSDNNKVIKLYHKLVERKTLRTVVGLGFLKELQDQIIKGGIVTKESLPFIPIERNEKILKAYANEFEKEQVKKHQEMIEDYRIKLRNSRIISLFLAVIIVIMIFISIWSDRSVFKVFEDNMINKYAAWEEELNAREQALEAKEKSESIK